MVARFLVRKWHTMPRIPTSTYSQTQAHSPCRSFNASENIDMAADHGRSTSYVPGSIVH